MKNSIFLILLLGITQSIKAQCSANVPTYIIDLSATPDTTWILSQADAQNRLGQCCGVSTNEDCISFEITLNENAAGIYFDYDGAPSYGSLHWRVDCGPEYNLRDTICVTDSGPFTLTFCKPGNDNGNYTLISIPRPTFPDDQIVPRNCIQPLEVLGVEANSVTWQSISPGAPGQYNNLLSCTNCLEPVFTPDQSIPSEIHYQVCGYPILDYCVGNFLYCDTVKFFIQDSLQLTISPEQPSFCAGGSVQLTAQATGGDLVYNYIWYNSSLQIVGTGSTFQATEGGTYLCEVRDGNYEPGFCDNFIESVSVIESLPISVTAGSDQILCASTPNAAISGSSQNLNNVVWSGGTGTFQYGNSILNNIYIPSSADISNGSVTLTLSSPNGSNGCGNSLDQVQLFFTDSIQSSITDISLPCKDDIATINPVISGGTAPYSFSWSDGSTSQTNTIGEGNYCLTIIDDLGCQVTECIVVTEPPLLTSSFSQENVKCYGNAEGSIDVEVLGGVGPYTYNWSNGSTSQDLESLPEGLYVLEITDANGCSPAMDLSVTIEQPDQIMINSIEISNFNGYGVSCYGMQNGEIAVDVIGGTTPYLFEWNNGANSQSIFDLAVGIYSVSVKDSNGCIVTGSAEILQPDSLTVTINPNDVSCNGGTDGWIDVTVSGGVPSYTYNWSSGQNSEDIATLSEGEYALTVSDANNCYYVADLVVIDPTMLEVEEIVSNVSCFNSSDGSVDISCIGGTMPYSFQWSNGQNVEDINQLPSGQYSAVITDANGCWTQINVTVDQPDSVQMNGTSTNPTCYGETNGQIDLEISGGTAPYAYSWSNGCYQQNPSNLGAGNYSLTITDANNCIYNQTFSLTEPNSLSLDLNSPVYFHDNNVSMYGGNDGSINANVSGGTEPYICTWSNGCNSPDQNNLSAGVYYLTIEDAMGCKIADSIVLTEPNTLELPTVYTPNEDGDNDAFEIHGIEAYPNNEFIVVNRWGNVVYEENHYNNTWKGTHSNGQELPDGVYFVILKINKDEIERNTYVHIKRF